MTTLSIPKGQPDWRSRFWQRFTGALLITVGVAAGVARSSARPLAKHLADHAYSILGFGFIDSAAFVHSLFSGLLVTGVSFIFFEWKVSDDDGSA